MYRSLSLVALAAMFSSPALAIDVPHQGHAQHAAHYPKKAKSAPTRAYIKAMNRMHRGMDIRYGGDPDTDFARGMIPHHQGAVDMAEVVLKYGRDPQVRELAEWIITVQKQEIAWMKHWVDTRGVEARLPAEKQNREAIEELKWATDKMHRTMHIKYTGDADVDFVRGMIPHHQGAIDMARALVRHGQAEEMNDLAWGIIGSQEHEIDKMQDWLERYGK